MAAKPQIDISAGLVPQQQIDLSAGMVPMQGQQTAAPPDNPADHGFWHSFASSLGLPTSTEEMQQMQDEHSFLKHPSNLLHPALAPAVRSYIEQLKQAGTKAKNEVGESIQNVRAGQPVLPNIGKGLAGLEQGAIGAVPLVGSNINNLSEQVLKENYGGAAGTTAGTVLPFLLGAGKNAPAAAAPEAEYLGKLPTPAGAEPITLTAGERSGPGAVNAIEPIAAKTSLVAGKVSKFLADRQAVLKQSLDNYRKLITEGAPSPAPSDLASGVQNEGAAALQRSAQVRDALNEHRASSLTVQPASLDSELPQTLQNKAAEALRRQELNKKMEEALAAHEISGRGAMTAGEAGSDVANALKQWQEEAKGAEAQAHGAVRSQAGSLKATFDTASPVADDIVRQAGGAKSFYGSTIPDPLLSKIRNAGMRTSEELEALAKDQYNKPLSSLLPEERDTLFKVAKRFGISTESTPATGSMGDALRARSDLLHDIRQAQKSGSVSPEAAGALQQLAKAMSDDIGNQLPEPLSSQWKEANALTRERYEDIRNPFIKSILNEAKPFASEDIVQRLLQKGNETDIADMLHIVKDNPQAMSALRRSAVDSILQSSSPEAGLKALEQRPGLRNILGDGYVSLRNFFNNRKAAELNPEEQGYQTFLNNIKNQQEPLRINSTAFSSPAYAERLLNLSRTTPEALAKLRRAAIDFVHNAPDARAALRNLEQHPGIQTILGERYKEFQRSLQNQAALEFSPKEKVYNDFLKRVTNMQEPEKIAATALKSPAYASRIQKLLEGRPEMGKQFGQQLFQQVLDNSTKNGAFGTKGAYFDPVKFAEEYRRAEPNLSKFIDKDVLTNLHDFADNVEKLTFSSKVPLSKQGSLTASYKGLKTLNTIATGGGILTGHPWLGVLPVAITELAPRAFLQIAMSPAGARWLAGETRMAALGRQGAAAGILASQATRPAAPDRTHNPQEPESAAGR